MSKIAQQRRTGRITRHRRVRKKIHGTAERPRLAVFRSNKHVTVQVIDDDAGRTLIAAATTQKDVLGKNKPAANRATAEVVGKLIAERARAKKIDKVVFDRGGFQYQGKVKALADAAREGGLKF
jgi:large subunit ribosomal protein L18